MNSSNNVLSSSYFHNDASVILESDIINDVQLQIFLLVNQVFLGGFVSVFGILTNVVNLIICYKQGLNTTINISFFAMGVSDLCGMLFQLWYIICIIPHFEGLRITMVYYDVQFITGGVPREVFARITCLITAYITAERCLCIAFPLHIKQLITVKRTTIIIIFICLMTWSYSIPLYCVCNLDWKFYPDRNETLLGLVVTSNRDAVEGMIFFIHGIIGMVSLLAVVLFTSVLTQKLYQKNVWHQTRHMHPGKAQSMSKRDGTTMIMLVLIASILIISYIPAVLLLATTFCVPELSSGGKLFKLYHSMWSIALLAETINSAVNIFLYLKMSTKYRLIFKNLFS